MCRAVWVARSEDTGYLRASKYVAKLVIENVCPTACYFLRFRFKYSSQHPVFNHPQSIFFFQCDNLNVVPIQNNQQKYNSVHLKTITVFGGITPRPSRSSSPRRSFLGLLNPTDGKTMGSETVNIYQSKRNLISKDLIFISTAVRNSNLAYYALTLQTLN